MNENITHRIIEYLKFNSNFAIILSGEYGIGKTHFLKNIVFPEVERLPIPQTDEGEIQKNFKTIHISLFGVKSIEEIQKALFLEIYPILKSKGAKITKGVLKGVGQFFSIDIDEIIADSKMGTKHSGFENILICIDDIDRKNPELDLSEVYGYVNDLVENHKAKIIMIANEDRLRKEQNAKGQDNYSILREKVIGVTLPFISDPDNAFDQIIKENYNTKEPDYYEFLKIHKQEIIRVVRQADGNLRNLLFFLEHFKIVFKEALSYFNANPEVVQYAEKIKIQLLTFTLPLAIEYKLGMLDKANQETIQELYTNSLQFDFSQALFGNKEAEKTYRDEFKDKYFKDVPMDKNFFSSVFNYILGSDEFTKEKLGEDIAFYLKITDKTVPEEQKLLQELGYWDCIDLSEEDYKTKTNELIGFIQNGRISLEQYITAFHYAIRFKNILEYDVEKLKDQFLESLNAHFNKFVEVPYNRFQHGVPFEAEFRDHLMAINDECMRINKLIIENNKQKKWLEKYDAFKTDFDNFIEESSVINSDTSLEPYLSYFPENETAEFILSLSKRQILSFASYIQHRYKSHNASFLKADLSFLATLKSEVLVKYDEPGKDKISKLALSMLMEDIDKAIQILSMPSNASSEE